MKKWFEVNKLTLSQQKTKYLNFSSNKVGLPDLGILQVTNELKISNTNATKYLGIHIDQHLRWDVHMNN